MKQNLETVLTFTQLAHKSYAFLWRPCDVLTHYLMFKPGEASVSSDICLALTHYSRDYSVSYQNGIQLRFRMVAQTHSPDLAASRRWANPGAFWNDTCRAIPHQRLVLVPQEMWLRSALWVFSAFGCPADSKLGGFVGLQVVLRCEASVRQGFSSQVSQYLSWG